MTGGARRIGRAISRELARAGMNVAIHARGSLREADVLCAEIRHEGVESLVVDADQRDVAAIRRACEAVWEHFGAVDFLVNSAAIWPQVRLEECEQEDFDVALETDLRGPFFWARYLGVRMKARGSGAIVSIGDVIPARPSADCLPYCLAKGGIEIMTYGLAKALAPEVRVNAIGPGPILFPPEYPPDRMEADRRATLRGVEGRPEDIARAGRFLLESENITGVLLPVDGGYRFGI